MTTPLTIGCASYTDYKGVWATVSALKFYHPETANCEIIVVENSPSGCQSTEDFCKSSNVRYSLQNSVKGTAFPRDCIFRLASCQWVLVIDSHVMVASGAIGRLMQWATDHPTSNDLYQGPMMHDCMTGATTHLSDTWRANMWGTWATDRRGLNPESPPFEIGMQGCGLFFARKSAWPGFNPNFRSFGGEEGYIQAKYARRGDKTWCLPWLRWTHRNKPERVRPDYPMGMEDRVRNYFLGFDENRMDPAPVFQHFSQHIPMTNLEKIRAAAVADNRKSGLGV